MPELFGLTLGLHSLMRWVVMIVGVIALARFAYGWLKANTAFGESDQRLAQGFAGVVTAQFMLGLANLILLLIMGAFRPGAHIEHVIYGVIITGLATSGARRWRDAPARTHFRNLFFVVLITIALALFSVWRLRGSFFYGL